jgi:putative methyltransferase (TIGR04325 family)
MRESMGRSSLIEFRGPYASWRAAQEGSDGYDLPAILEKQVAVMLKVRDGKAAWERDSVEFAEIEYSFPVLAALLYAAGRNRNRLSVLDFGGALGGSYYQNRGFLGHLDRLRWRVVEQPHFVAAGKQHFENDTLGFVEDLEQCVAAEMPDVILLSSVLQYLEEPFAFLRRVAALGAPFILIDRSPTLRAQKSRISVQVVPPQIYAASYPCWLFAESEVLAPLEGAYAVRLQFDAHIGTPIVLGAEAGGYRGAFLERVPAQRGAGA